MRKHSDMMQVDVVHCCQVEKEVATLGVDDEGCIAQLAVAEEEEEGSDAVEASDASFAASCRGFLASASPAVGLAASHRGCVVISSLSDD